MEPRTGVQPGGITSGLCPSILPPTIALQARQVETWARKQEGNSGDQSHLARP